MTDREKKFLPLITDWMVENGIGKDSLCQLDIEALAMKLARFLHLEPEWNSPDQPPDEGDNVRASESKFELVAVSDGAGLTATWYLCVEYNGNIIDENGMKWPDDWPERVSAEFLREKGFKTVVA